MASPYNPYAEARAMPETTQTSSTLAPNRPSHGHPAAFDEPRDPDPTWTILLTGAVIVLAVVVVGLGLIIQLFVMHLYHTAGGAVYSTAPLGRTLTIAHVTSVVVSMSAPFTIGLGAYWLAGKWLAASRDEGLDRPTPYQLGILMTTLNRANLSALWNGSTYIVGRGTIPGGKTLARPPILRYAVWMLFTFLALAYASAGSELWLGATSEAVLYPVIKAADAGVLQPMYGRRINQTECDATKDLSNNKPYQCGLIRGSGGNPQAAATNVLTVNGVSDTTIIAFTDDSTAIMVPPPSLLPANLDYTATTPGVRSDCTSVTSQCVGANLNAGAGPGVVCPPSVGFNTSFSPLSCNMYTGSDVGGPLDATGQILPCYSAAASAEFRFATIVRSSAYIPKDSSDFVGNTGFYFHSKAAVNVVICNVKSLAVTYRYFNGSYTLVSAAPSDVPQGQRISDGSVAGPFYVPPAIEGVGISSGSYVDAFAQKLSQVALSMTAYIIEPSEAISHQFIVPNIGSRLPLAPLLLLFLISFIYCTLVAAIMLLAVLELRKSPHTAFARSRLVDPTTAISTAYGPDDSKLKMTRSPQELFGHETAADRLNVGVSSRAQGLPAVRRSSTLAAQPSWEK
ncbi:hypothetical protein C8J57DRAFT_1395984 [Mycena rebaudengoi]|nr:hypothetical protein C8J57DRAFT_1395984 [Mycena rebaudengoi]